MYVSEIAPNFIIYTKRNLDIYGQRFAEFKFWPSANR